MSCFRAHNNDSNAFPRPSQDAIEQLAEHSGKSIVTWQKTAASVLDSDHRRVTLRPDVVSDD